MTAALATLGLDDRRWTELVRADARATVFHHPAWHGTVADTYGYRPFVLGLEDGAGGLAAGLPVVAVRALRGRRWVALPFTDHCPPLGPGRDELATCLDAARRAAGVARLDVHAEIPAAGGFLDTAGAVTHVLELQEDAEAVRRTFKRSQVQRNIKKAERSGVTVRRATCAADLTDAYFRLHVATRRRLGVPVQPRRFFARLWDRVIEPGLGFVLLAEAGGTAVAGAVFLTWNETVIYKYGASDSSAWGLRPNHAIFWDAIRSSCAAGHRSFDFGRSDAEDTGLREFKGGWGTRELALTYTAFAERAPAPGSGRATRVLGPVMRRSPAWTLRAAGELLYKYAA